MCCQEILWASTSESPEGLSLLYKDCVPGTSDSVVLVYNQIPSSTCNRTLGSAQLLLLPCTHSSRLFAGDLSQGIFIGECQANFDGHSWKHTVKSWQLLRVHPRMNYENWRVINRWKLMLYDRLNMQDEEVCYSNHVCVGVMRGRWQPCNLHGTFTNVYFPTFLRTTSPQASLFVEMRFDKPYPSYDMRILPTYYILCISWIIKCLTGCAVTWTSLQSAIAFADVCTSTLYAWLILTFRRLMSTIVDVLHR